VTRRLVIALVLLGFAAPAADAAVCTYLPPPAKVSKKERLIRDMMERREFWTLPHGRELVKRLIADDAAWKRSVLDFPMTPQDAAYFRRRDRLRESPGWDRLARYMRSHREIFSETNIEDDYPRVHLLLGVTRDLERHRRAIRRIYPYRFKLSLVPFGAPELRRVQRRIDPDALEAEGIDPIVWGAGMEHVELEAATERPDAQEVVRRMYGPAVKLLVRGPTPTTLDCQGPALYEVAPDGRTLTVHFGNSGSITPRHVEVVETGYGVDLGVVVESPFIVTADLRYYTLTVTLAEPLGKRPVRSIEYGYRVRRGKPR
jgi:hypothetical protein